MSLARISLTLSRHFCLSFIFSGRSSGLHTVSSHSCCMYVRAGRPAFAWPYVLCFDLLTRPKMSFKVTHRKQVTHSNGSYERESRGRKLADEMGRGKKKFPLYSHRLTHRKRVTSELHDSYFHSMTITQAFPKIAEVTHPRSPDIGRNCGGVSISPRGSLKVI